MRFVVYLGVWGGFVPTPSSFLGTARQLIQREVSCLISGAGTLSAKDQRINIFGFAARVVSVTTVNCAVVAEKQP